MQNDDQERKGAQAEAIPSPRGALAKACGYDLPLQILKSQAGFYLGTWQDGPITRESAEYWRSQRDAETALILKRWTQRLHL